MEHRPERSNRGPAAAPENRRAILQAARKLFTERGYHVPLSAIAREAGVGQGVLYRHFPTRLDLAHAVFEVNFAELERIAADEDALAFARFWGRLVDLTISEAAFVEMVVDARRTQEDYDGGRRLRRMLEPLLDRAHRAGTVPATLSLDDIVLVQRMVFGVVVTAIDDAEARTSVDRVMSLVGLGGGEGDGAPRDMATPSAPRR